MSAAWVVHALAVGALLGGAAWSLDRALTLARIPTRGAWIGALAGLVLLTALSPLREEVPTPVASSLAPTEQAAEDRGGPRAATGGLPVMAALARAADLAAEALQASLGAAARAASSFDRPGARRGFVLLWALASIALLAAMASTLVRHGRARRAWPIVELAGERVRVAPGGGPALVGLVHPEIIVPAWLLQAGAERQRLAVAHEREHRRAWDHLLLALGGLALVLLPWHPAAWWMHRRLRAAVELDCDGRVLGGGAPRRVYAALLLDVAGHRSRLPLGASALGGAPTHLERRILAMTRQHPRHAAPRAAASVGAAALLALLACGTELPTSAQIEAMDVAGMEATLAERGALPADGAVRYVVDGVETRPEAARALAPEAIARVEVRRSGDQGAPHTIQITTVAGAGAPAGSTVRTDVREVPVLTTRDTRGGGVVVRARADTDEVTLANPSGFDGLLVVNGEAVEREVLGRIRPGEIESIEVVKGAAAAQAYADPAARNGVIRVTLKPGATVR